MPTWEEIAGWISFEKVSYVEIPASSNPTLVYREVNGEVLIDKGVEEAEELIVAFRAQGNRYGQWYCSVYRSNSGQYYLKAEWIPEVGHAWEETVIYRLNLR